MNVICTSTNTFKISIFCSLFVLYVFVLIISTFECGRVYKSPIITAIESGASNVSIAGENSMIHLPSGVSRSAMTRFGHSTKQTTSQKANHKEPIHTPSPMSKWTKGLLLLAPIALPNFALAQEPAKSNGPAQAPQVQTTPPAVISETDFQKQLQTTQTKIDALDAALKSQKTSIEALAARLSKIEKEVGYEQFAALKQAAITKAQDATFILNLMTTRTESTPSGTITYMSIGKSISGTVVKDQNGKIALFSAWKPLKEAQKSNPDLKLKLVFEPTATDSTRIESDSKLLKNGTLKNYSEQFDLALLEVPTDNKALTQRLEAVALPLENYVGKSFQPGTEALAIGRPFGFPRYVTQGIISDHDKDGSRKHNSVSNQFPKLWTDTGIANGSEGGPLLGFNWEKKQWDVMGIVSSGTNEVMNYAVPVDVVSSFLQQRGYQTVDLKDPAQAKVAEDYHKLDQAKQ
jgi:hypothetical protein